MGSLCSGNIKNETYETPNVSKKSRSKPSRVIDEKTVLKSSYDNRNDKNSNKIDETDLVNSWEKAINVADEDLILKLLTNFSDKLLDHEFSNGDFAVHICAKKGHKEILNHLLTFGDDILKKNSETGNTALHYAVETRNLNLTLFLIGKSLGDLINIKNNNGELPYDLAKESNNPVLIVAVTPSDLLPKVERSGSPVDAKALIQAYCDGTVGQSKKMNKNDLIDSWEKSINNGDEDTAFRLLDEYSDDLLDHKFGNGNFAIHVCAQKGYDDIIYYLVEYGDDICRQNSKNGNTALHYAVETRNLELAQYLFFQSEFKGGKITEIKNDKGKLAYDLALKTNDEELITFVTPKNKRGLIESMILNF